MSATPPATGSSSWKECATPARKRSNTGAARRSSAKQVRKFDSDFSSEGEDEDDLPLGKIRNSLVVNEEGQGTSPAKTPSRYLPAAALRYPVPSYVRRAVLRHKHVI